MEYFLSIKILISPSGIVFMADLSFITVIAAS